MPGFKIQIDAEEAIRRIGGLFEDRWQYQIQEALEQIAAEIDIDIRSDPNIPEEYKKALFIAVLDPFTVAVDVMWDVALLYEKGTETQWQLYRCPKLKYFGGVIKKGQEKNPYMSNLIKDINLKYQARLADRIREILVGAMM